MTYELAKELKGAGFPQKKFRGSDWVGHTDHEFGEFWVFGDEYKNLTEMRQNFKKYKLFLDPTLDTLIEACGDDFKRLQKGFHGGWYANSWNHPNGLVAIRGKTPEEAVARLWLTINLKTL